MLWPNTTPGTIWNWARMRGLEAQLAALSDDVAYNSHDLLDGLRAGLFTEEDIAQLPVLDACFAEVDRKHPGTEAHRRRHEALRRFFGVLVQDVIEATRANLTTINPKSAADVRHAGKPIARFSSGLWADLKVIRAFLFSKMYRAPKVVEMRAQVTEVVNDLFPMYLSHPQQMPSSWAARIEAATTETELARLVADYIAGMTDRFALEEHARLCAR